MNTETNEAASNPVDRLEQLEEILNFFDYKKGIEYFLTRTNFNREFFEENVELKRLSWFDIVVKAKLLKKEKASRYLNYLYEKNKSPIKKEKGPYISLEAIKDLASNNRHTGRRIIKTLREWTYKRQKDSDYILIKKDSVDLETALVYMLGYIKRGTKL